jgi:dolichyl-phosphate beta-glucosyltransferase
MMSGGVAQRSFFRNILMYGFHFLVLLVGVHGIKDTQCGFKLFSREAARILFPAQHVERWCFDVELVMLAQSLGMPVAEVAVKWEEKDGSKLDPVWSSVQMAKDIAFIRLYYSLGIWTVPNTKRTQ